MGPNSDSETWEMLCEEFQSSVRINVGPNRNKHVKTLICAVVSILRED